MTILAIYVHTIFSYQHDKYLHLIHIIFLMLRALKAYAAENNIQCWISLEEKMACGVGACLACVCQSKEKDEHSQVHNKRICKDGPVFLADEIEL